MQVDVRAEQNMCALAACFQTEQRADLAEQSGVPRRTECDAGGHRHARRSAASMAFAADAGRAVGHLDCRDAGVGEGACFPGSPTGDQAALVAE